MTEQKFFKVPIFATGKIASDVEQEKKEVSNPSETTKLKWFPREEDIDIEQEDEEEIKDLRSLLLASSGCHKKKGK